MKDRLQGGRGQAVLLTVIFLFVVLGAAALTIDVGAWYREQRQAQATADQAVLSGAQTLPVSSTQALADTQTYADKNGGSVVLGSLKLLSGLVPNDTVTVTIERPAPNFLAQVFGIGSVTVHASAAARAGLPMSVYGAAPIVVSKQHPLLSGPAALASTRRRRSRSISKGRQAHSASSTSTTRAATATRRSPAGSPTATQASSTSASTTRIRGRR